MRPAGAYTLPLTKIGTSFEKSIASPRDVEMMIMTLKEVQSGCHPEQINSHGVSNLHRDQGELSCA